jgi:hypothetical protein
MVWHSLREGTMKAPFTCFAGALCVLALAGQVTACGDDDDKSDAKSEADSKSGGVSSEETKPRTRDTAAAGTGAVLTENTCLAGASRFPQASQECLGCVCETIATCGAACQELLVCTLTSCTELLGDSVALVACALKNCAAQANAPGAAIGLTQAVAGLAACGPACQPPPPPLADPDASTPEASADAGATDGTDAGLE